MDFWNRSPDRVRAQANDHFGSTGSTSSSTLGATVGMGSYPRRLTSVSPQRPGSRRLRHRREGIGGRSSARMASPALSYNRRPRAMEWEHVAPQHRGPSRGQAAPYAPDAEGYVKTPLLYSQAIGVMSKGPYRRPGRHDALHVTRSPRTAVSVYFYRGEMLADEFGYCGRFARSDIGAVPADYWAWHTGGNSDGSAAGDPS